MSAANNNDALFSSTNPIQPKNGTDQLVSINDNKRAEEIRNLLTLTPSSDLETEGSPQHLALKWIVDEDPLAISLESDDAIRERFAAATLHFATNGPEKWNESLGFLSNNSICSWNIDSVEESNGIFCQDGRVNQINVGKNFEIACSKNFVKANRSNVFTVSCLCKNNEILYHCTLCS